MFDVDIRGRGNASRASFRRFGVGRLRDRLSTPQTGTPKLFRAELFLCTTHIPSGCGLCECGARLRAVTPPSYGSSVQEDVGACPHCLTCVCGCSLFAYILCCCDFPCVDACACLSVPGPLCCHPCPCSIMRVPRTLTFCAYFVCVCMRACAHVRAWIPRVHNRVYEPNLPTGRRGRHGPAQNDDGCSALRFPVHQGPVAEP